MVTIQQLSFRYGKKDVLNDISMRLEPGKIYGLLGENGVGKTTLLKVIAGLQKPWNGSCSVFGENPFNRTPSFLSRVYYLPEELEFIQNDYSIRFFAKINGPYYPNFDHEKFEAILKEFAVEGDKKLNKLSHGQAKKGAIAFALATNVDLLLMDEPSNGLDIPSKTLFRRAIVKHVPETTCTLISTHQVRDLENLIDPIIILDNKAVLMNASLEEISEKLYFGLHTSIPAHALYSEPVPGGYLCVMENDDLGESKVNLEALFNATMQHKKRMQEHFTPDAAEVSAPSLRLE